MVKKIKDNKILINNLIMSILVIVLYFVWPTVINIPLQIFGITFEEVATNTTPISQIVYNLVFSLILMIILIMIYRKTFKKDIKDFKENKKSYLVMVLKYTLITFVSVIAVNALKEFIFNVKEVAENDMALYTYYRELPYLMIFMTVIYYPIVEEIVFDKTIKDLIKNKWLYIIISSLFFWYFNIAFIGITVTSIVSSAFYFVIAFIRAYAYQKTDNLLVPIGIKMFYNLLVTLISL